MFQTVKELSLRTSDRVPGVAIRSQNTRFCPNSGINMGFWGNGQGELPRRGKRGWPGPFPRRLCRPCSPCRKCLFRCTVVCAKGAAAVIPGRLPLPPAAAARNSRNDTAFSTSWHIGQSLLGLADVFGRTNASCRYDKSYPIKLPDECQRLSSGT